MPQNTIVSSSSSSSASTSLFVLCRLDADADEDAAGRVLSNDLLAASSAANDKYGCEDDVDADADADAGGALLESADNCEVAVLQLWS